ncbi:hypothetical protein GGR95_002976 [Sulfitobacter undariae]|uniref:Uncharacterized protein n=1 Tax=Sulfitobacter undariae TaxID=1563671 RepID=A0A7W6E8A8_9RHOB|nr:hypothetical protein [Sulfitobacter undariae]MBB3995321.1 hypothetical protein [Sulfitobacter undariae]
MHKILDNLKSIEGLWSLLLLIKENRLILGSVLTVLYGPLLPLWSYVQLAAENVGWWVYPFVLFLLICASIGVFIGALALLGKVRLGSQHQWYERREVAQKARDLSQGIAELHAELVSEKQQIWETVTQSMRSGERGPDRSSEAKTLDRIAAKFAQKYQSKLFETVSEARVFLPLNQSERWSIQHGLMSPHMLPDIILFLNELAVNLSDDRGQIPLRDR